MLQLRNIDVWYSNDSIYFRDDNERLLKIGGIDSSKVKEVINFLLQKPLDINSFESQNISKTEYNEIIAFLEQHHLITIPTEVKDSYNNIRIFGNSEIINQIQTKLPEYSIKSYSENDLSINNNISLLIILGPISDHYDNLKNIGIESYKKGINLLYAEINSNSFTVGPLVIPKLNTSSLACYIKRRFMNINSQKLYSEFIEAEKHKILKSTFTQYNYFSSSIEQLVSIIKTYIKYDGLCSQHFIEKSITINYASYNIEKFIVLKDPFSKLFIQSTYSPFNG